MKITLAEKICKSPKQNLFESQDSNYQDLIRTINILLKKEFNGIILQEEEKWSLRQVLILKEIIKTKTQNPETFKKFMNTEGVFFKLNLLSKNKSLKEYVNQILEQ